MKSPHKGEQKITRHHLSEVRAVWARDVERMPHLSATWIQRSVKNLSKLQNNDEMWQAQSANWRLFWGTTLSVATSVLFFLVANTFFQNDNSGISPSHYLINSYFTDYL